MRGSHPGSFDAAHALRDGTFWDTAGTPQDTGETYDLIVVGGGISGLAAAHFYRKHARRERAHPDPRQSRRLRRTRQAQRVSRGQRISPGFRRDVFHREPCALQQRSARPDRGAWASTSPPIPSITMPICIARWDCVRISSSTKKHSARTVWSPVPHRFSGGETDYTDPDENSGVEANARPGPMAPQAKTDLDAC